VRILNAVRLHRDQNSRGRALESTNEAFLGEGRREGGGQ
jgi:hypothetical protein